MAPGLMVNPWLSKYSKIVYSTQSSDVTHVMLNGQWVLKDSKLATIDEDALISSIDNLKNQFL